jgi:uncharacterized protein YndB with AHSA1/START domain
MSTDRIEKQVELKAPVSRVWRALTDHREFGQWFRVELRGPFAPGKTTGGPITYEGYEHLTFEVLVEAMEPERLFSFLWHPYAIEPEVDYSAEPRTLVEFRLQAIPGGTLLTVSESGFDKLPAGRRRTEAFRMNSDGWSTQLTNIEQHLRDAA